MDHNKNSSGTNDHNYNVRVKGTCRAQSWQSKRNKVRRESESERRREKGWSVRVAGLTASVSKQANARWPQCTTLYCLPGHLTTTLPTHSPINPNPSPNYPYKTHLPFTSTSTSSSVSPIPPAHLPVEHTYSIHLNNTNNTTEHLRCMISTPTLHHA